MKKYLFIAAMAALALLSCKKEETVINRFSPINEISVKCVNALTKSAFGGTEFPAGYDMLVSAYRTLDASVKGDDVAADFFEGILFSKNGDVWKAGKYWPLTGKLDFLCIACAGLNTASNGVEPSCVWGESGVVSRKVVVTVPDNGNAFDDILYGAANAQTYSASGNAVAFKHAMSAVVFTAHSNVAYDAASNVGITIDSISVNGAKYSGTLTVSNPAAGGSGAQDTLTAVWSELASTRAYLRARVWDSANTGSNAVEKGLDSLNLTSTSAQITDKPFGDAYVILPEQDAVPFTVYYTIHNGFQADGVTALNNHIQYKYTPAENSKWVQSTKNVYDIGINLNEITIAPTVSDWSVADAKNIQISQ